MNTNEYQDLQLPETDGTVQERIDQLVRTMLIRGELGGNPTAIMLGQHYHLGGLPATEMLARQAAFTADDTVLDVCCSVGGSVRYLAESVGCSVVGLDIDAKAVALARRLTELSGLQDRVTFVEADLYQVDQLGMHFTGIWSEASLDNSLDWLPALDGVLLPGGKLAFSLCVRMKGAPSGLPNTLDDVVSHLREQGFDILYCEDMREWEIEHGWKALLRQLDERQRFYEDALGVEWVQSARERFHSEIDIWSREAGNAFFVGRSRKVQPEY